jgi:hypothetical protein
LKRNKQTEASAPSLDPSGLPEARRTAAGGRGGEGKGDAATGALVAPSAPPPPRANADAAAAPTVAAAGAGGTFRLPPPPPSSPPPSTSRPKSFRPPSKSGEPPAWIKALLSLPAPPASAAPAAAAAAPAAAASSSSPGRSCALRGVTLHATTRRYEAHLWDRNAARGIAKNATGNEKTEAKKKGGR